MCLSLLPNSSFDSKGIDLKLLPNSLTIITGPSGCGKSTFLRDFLGERHHVQGSISITSDELSYCPQSPWLFIATIRENICGLGNAIVDNGWYREVLHSCTLNHDLQKLPNSDLTIIDGLAANLSWGQKQRIALARAFYHKPKLLLLEDVLSALDANTETWIMQKMLGSKGLFRRLDTAVVLVTHAVKYDSAADNIISTDETRKMAMRTNIPIPPPSLRFLPAIRLPGAVDENTLKNLLVV